MTLEYHIGNAADPKGHALIYFRDGSNPDKIGASYLVILPVAMDISKYVPPFLAGQVEQFGSGDMSSFAFPPAPEPVESEAWLRKTAEKRGDDLLFGGVANLTDVTSLIEVVAGITEEYTTEYDEKSRISGSKSEQIETGSSTGAEAIGSAAPVDADVNDVMYSMMAEPDLLTELTTLMGRFQYESSGGDSVGARESESKIRSIAKHVPDNRRIDLLIEAATEGGENSAKKAQLYLERAFAMYREDYTRVHTIEQEIQSLSGD
ncbi:MAG: hypothetical protein HOF01_07455 [Chloroflexi bacterium]|jgi:hypothetical protein|nr:hypothetical protein [Chloroflexota bacterium]